MAETAAPAETLTPTQWWVQVRGQAYGPYSVAQLAQFVSEGRVRPSTQVSDAPAKGWVEARRIDALMAPLRAAEPKPETPAAQEAANVFVHVEIVSGAWTAFMAALESMGVVATMAPGLYLLRTRFGAGVVRNTLSQTLERGDRFVVIDATRDRLAWFNLGPEIDVKVREVWNGPLRADRK